MKLALFPPAFGAASMQVFVDYAKTKADEVIVNPYGRLLKEEEILKLWDGVDVLVAGGESYSAEVIRQAPKTLKVLVRWGVGYDKVDLDACKKQGIKVAVLKGCNSNAVAEYTIGAMLCVARLLPQHDSILRNKGWRYMTGTELAGKTLGIMGLGAIGKLVAKKALGLGMDVIAYDPYFDTEFAVQNGITQASVEEILSCSDFVSLHLPASPETIKMIDEAAISLMKPSAYLINSARGTLIDEKALYNALKERRICGAALDVYEHEPCFDNPLFDLDNVVVTPHMASITKEAASYMSELAINTALELYHGKDSKYSLI